uniref:Outer Dynein Arm Docking Complex putative n=1 Tax=Albugo laibachii Nc14 TaxID=890382 RepID=F0WKZ6_9STRA|nr:Outer Dynein Arm Docking Complex putative [Albugo laibachii Nc14]|eukprot:CCA21955.1 Outer Dynein Arm Docking Complex putative [Albugo laibachii Nc14]
MRSITDSTAESNGAELKQLQREYRNMEINRKVYADEVNRVVKRQQNTIDKLRKENEGLKKDVNLLTRQEKDTSMHQQQAQSATMRDKIRKLHQKTGSEQQKYDKLIQQIEYMRHQVLYQKKNMGGVHAPKDNQELIQKQIRILENRLHKSQSKFNSTLAQNKLYRDEIDDLRRERHIFDRIYKKIEKEHTDKKKQMTETIEWSNQAYQQRDEFHRQIREIQEKNRQETESHRKSMVEFQRRIDDVTGQGSSEKTSSASSLDHKRGGACSTIESNAADVEYGREGNTKESAQARSNQFLERCEEAMSKIQAATGFDDPNTVVDTFLSRENRNFSLFNHVNEQHGEIEKLQEINENLQHEEVILDNEDYGDDGNRAESLADSDILMKQKNHNSDMEFDHEGLRKKAQSYEAKCLIVQKIINAARFRAQALYNKIGCNADRNTESSDITLADSNIIRNLATIEQRANEILQQYTAVAQEENLSMTPQSSKVNVLIAPGCRTILPNKHEPKPSLLMQHAMRMGVLIADDQEPRQMDFPDLQDSSDEDSISNQKAPDEHFLEHNGRKNVKVCRDRHEKYDTTKLIMKTGGIRHGLHSVSSI